jgi:hypothetical protein
MAGSLIKIDEEIVTSAVNSISLTGIDSTYDVYSVVYHSLNADSTLSLQLRCLESGTPNTTSNYDRATKVLLTNSAFANQSQVNQSLINFSSVTTSSLYKGQGLLYIFNANNSSEYTFFTIEEGKQTGVNAGEGKQGGAVFTVASSVNGVQIGVLSSPSNNLTGGTFTLYGLKK